MKSRLGQSILILAAIGLVVLFLMVSSHTYQSGFPLDDAWIHQTFARNLAERGEWAFNPGQPAAGSTSPLWTALLSIGFLLKIPTLIWTNVLGTTLLCLIGLRVYDWFKRGRSPILALGLALLVMSEWHLVWAAASGMETILQAALFLVVLTELLNTKPTWLIIGICTGLAIWSRPDGITLLGPILVSLVVHWRRGMNSREVGWFLIPAGVLVAGYLWFNLAITGAIWPNTLYAKQMEYGETTGILVRFIRLWLAPLAGVGMVILPGFVIGIYQSLKKKDILRIATWLWVVGFVTLYAWKLPVTYQHGRYLMPILPVFLVFSLDSLLNLNLAALPERLCFILMRTYAGVIILTSLAFLVLGSQAYARDVAIIQTEMVEPAQWIAKNTPSDALVAAHDIGALGYFADREILDLAGLIDPQVIPWIRQPDQLSVYIQERNADYLMIFPGWYQPPLTLLLDEVFRSQGNFAIQSGGDQMVVYRIR